MAMYEIIKPGDKLRNGAIVIAVSMRRGNEYVVLALNVGGYEPYVTWRCSRPGHGDDTYAGHYFMSILRAVEDFYER